MRMWRPKLETLLNIHTHIAGLPTCIYNTSVSCSQGNPTCMAVQRHGSLIHALTVLALQDLYQWSGAASILPVLHLIEIASQVNPSTHPRCQQRCLTPPNCKVKADAFEAASQRVSILSLHCRGHMQNCPRGLQSEHACVCIGTCTCLMS